ncbi:MAG: ribbon-helix-helix domain-containing protein [Candidatus Bathyarchaeota archaeon]|nr:ribbon-helix-helix domain-containing protein [Candidatus Bathyarchaeota archaeon]
MRRHYRTIKLPKEMIETIEQLMKEHPEYGYVSIADFVKDSIGQHYCWYIHGIKFEKKRSS